MSYRTSHLPTLRAASNRTFRTAQKGRGSFPQDLYLEICAYKPEELVTKGTVVDSG